MAEENRAKSFLSLLKIDNREEVNEMLAETIRSYADGKPDADRKLNHMFESLNLKVDEQASNEVFNLLLLATKRDAGYHMKENYNWNTGTKLAPLKPFLNESKKKWSGKTDKGKGVEMGQDKSGMYYGEIRDRYGDIESSTTKKTKQEVDKWFSEQGIKKIKWNISETIVTGSDIVGKDSNLQGSEFTRRKDKDGLHRQEPKKRKYDANERDIEKKLEALKKLFLSRADKKITLTDIKKILQSESIEFRSSIKQKMSAASALIEDEPDCEQELLEYYFSDGNILNESSGGSSSSTSWNNWQGVEHQVSIKDGYIIASNTFLARLNTKISQDEIDYLQEKGVRVIFK